MLDTPRPIAALARLHASSRDTPTDAIHAGVVEQAWTSQTEAIPTEALRPGANLIGSLAYELGASLDQSLPNPPAVSETPRSVWASVPRMAPIDRTAVGVYSTGELLPKQPEADYIAGVERCLAYIRAGDCYQINLTHRLSAAFEGSPRGFFTEAAGTMRPAFGQYLEVDLSGDRRAAICCFSPERFIAVERTGRVVAEPMKGTRADNADAMDDLVRSEKDIAELAMITDLMRNDIGRLCRLGSVRVDEVRRIERHASGVVQASSVVSGERRDDVGPREVLEATFPPGSVTGAPKVRAVQIINELEDAERGHYCGVAGTLAIGDDTFELDLAVTIRTATIVGKIDPADPTRLVEATLCYPVGAGIVADSDPASEWAETLVKASALQALLRREAVASGGA